MELSHSDPRARRNKEEIEGGREKKKRKERSLDTEYFFSKLF